MNCEDFRDQLISYICSELSAEETTSLEKHLQSCQACRETASEFRTIEGLVQRLPQQEYDEKLRIRDLLRQRRRESHYLLSKAAIWVLLLTGAVTAFVFLPVHFEAGSGRFAIVWGASGSRVADQSGDLSAEVRELRAQLAAMQRQDRSWQQASETRIKQLVDQNNAEQQKRYFQTLQMFTNYVQLQRKADLQRINHDIAVNYDRTGQEVDKTNEMLQYVMKASATGNGVWR